MSQKKEALLLLEDGTAYKGIALGISGTTGGEICFNTGMTGYQEIYTDPSYYGQIIVNTNSHIGNYGVQLEDEEESASVKIRGMVCNTFSPIYSRHTADFSLQEYFERANIVGVSNVDTRHIVRHVRQRGVMNAIISSEILDEKELMAELKKIPSMDGLELSSEVTTENAYFVGEESSSQWRIAVMDYGIKKSILQNLTSRGCYCKVFPAKTPFEEVMSWQPDGFFISNGPGDPAAMLYAVESVNQMIKTSKPLFGICLGHQLLALSSGINTYKMHHGHRGLNHPVKNLITGFCEVTSQNHGFAVNPDEIENHPDIEITHVNLNDKTIEGIRRKDYPAFSVQYHPEASPGPHDSRYLFDEFIKLLRAS
ncbi:glutamine-hydrolyzing carbamoyl-phosphate synthase small subunit [Dyadobacter sp. LJ53]|uniref:glutamine-hydrolyzing carbamoyl-phosphate synthase small subunit n=1 Tax=Dyadobacter chenwenxiniae TaxID=2906456 RepID=UPI001F49254D|nr:glutamine-hydrolyzing carbamoyl-phosphate synthase small subunit [Dyadobacter chenwenxiniae]MCF0053096.1 glutamine-hydrolyzing carbamoyl-phosphate synthase small subunit [Dyadobacter chenwenxiniae]